MARVRIQVLIAGVLSTLVAVGAAGAQTVNRPWEVEVHAGGIWSNSPSRGDAALPPPSNIFSFPAPAPLPPFDSARIVSSWYFGDGAHQLNQAVGAGYRVSMVPLDDVLQSPFVNLASGASVGVRIGRRLTRRLGAEFLATLGLARASLSAKSVTGIELSSVTYGNLWRSVLRTYSAATIDSDATVDESGGRPFTGTGTLLVTIFPRGRVDPYLAVGGGILTWIGDGSSAHIEGVYGFTIPPPTIPLPIPIPILPVVVSDHDSVAIRSILETRGVFVVGAGVRYQVGRRTGLRLDLRDHMFSDTRRTEIDVTPAIQPGNLGLIIAGPPALTFSQMQGTIVSTARATLSGPPLTAFETFKGTGMAHHLNFGAGLYWRF